MTSDDITEGPDVPRREVRIPDGEDTGLDRRLAEHTEAIDRRLEEGMTALQHAAAKLMRQLAAEVWMAAGPEAGERMQESILSTLAQNDAIRGLLAHTDERFQSLQARVGELEDHVRQLAEATRDAIQEVRQADPQAEEHRRELAERVERLRDEIGEELRRVESAVRGELTEGLAATRGELADRIDRAIAEAGETGGRIEEAIAGTGERTGVVLDGLRAELGARLADVAGGGPEVGERIEALAADLAERLSRLEASQEAQRQGIEAYGAQAAEGVAEMARRLQGEIAALAERAEEAERRTAERSDRLEDVVRGFHQQVEGFRERAAEGLTEVGQRIRDGFEMMVDRSVDQQKRALAEVESGLRQDLIDTQRDVLQVAARTGTVLEGIHADLIERLEGAEGSMRDEAIHLVAQVVGRHAGQQGRNLQAITESLRSLLDAVRRSGSEQAQVLERVLRASAGRQETLLDESLAVLRSSLEELGGVYTGTKKPATPEDAGSFTRRLRSVEQRLERLSRELTSELPSAG